MRAVRIVPKSANRDFTEFGNEEYPSWQNVPALTVDRPFPANASGEISDSSDLDYFARAYTSYEHYSGASYVSDIRLVQDGAMVGSNLLDDPVELASGEMRYSNYWSGGLGNLGSAYGSASVSYDPSVDVNFFGYESASKVHAVKVITSGANAGMTLLDDWNLPMTLSSGDDVFIKVRVRCANAGRYKIKDTTLSYDSGWFDAEANEWKELFVRVQAGGSVTLNPVVIRETADTFWAATFEIFNNPYTSISVPVDVPVDYDNTGFGLAVSFELGELGMTEHLVLTNFDFNIMKGSTITGFELDLASAFAYLFLPPSYPSLVKLFITKVGITYDLPASGLKLSGEGSIDSFIKFDGYEHKTKNLERRYQYMVYSNGKFLGELNDVEGSPTIRTALNTFPGDVTVNVARNADTDFADTDPLEIVDDGEAESIVTERNETMDVSGETHKSFGEGTIIDTNNNIDIYEYYGNYEGFVLDDGEPLLFSDLQEMETPVGSPEGLVYFSGYISKYDMTYGKKSKKTSKLTLLSHTDEYNNIVLEKTDEDFLAITGGESYLNVNAGGETVGLGVGRSPMHTPAKENSALGQSFIFASAKTLSSIYLKVKRWGATDMSPSQYPVLMLDLIKETPNSPGVTVISTSAAITKNKPYWQAFPLPTNITLDASQRYSIVVRAADPLQAGMYSADYPIQLYPGDSYADGAAYIARAGAEKGMFGVETWLTGGDLQMRLATRGGDTLVPMFSIDPSQMMKNIVDYGESRGSLIRYLENSIMNSSTVVSAKFNVQTLKECLDAIITYTPTDWYWYIDQSDLTLYLNARSDEVSHIFTLGKDIEELKLEKSMEDLVNEVYFTGGQATATVPTPFENKAYQGGSASGTKVASQVFLPEANVEYKVYADYPGKSCQVAVYKYYSNSSTPTGSPTFVDSGRAAFKYDPVLEPTLTGICVVAQTSDTASVTPSSMTLSMVSDSNVFRHLVNEQSQAAFRKALVKKSDQRVTNSASADIIANAEMERNPAPIHVGTLTVIRNEYLKQVHPGQLVGFKEFGNFIDYLQLVVMEVELNRDIMTLSLGAFAPKTSKRLEDLKRNLQMLEQANNPNAPTTTGGV